MEEHEHSGRRATWRDMWRVARTPRMLGVLVIILVGAAVCIRLGAWQLDRAVARAEHSQQVELEAREEAPPVPIADIVAPQTSFTQDMVGRRVETSGTYEGPQYFVPGKLLPDPADPGDRDLWTEGYWVLAPLHTEEGALLPVVRGWVAETYPAYLDTEGQQVRAVLYLAGSEEAGEGPDGDRVGAVSPAQLVNVWDGPIYSGFGIVAAEDGAAPAADGLPEPEAVAVPSTDGGGLNLQSLAYAGEWFVFGGFAVLIYVRQIRDEAGRRVASDEPAQVGA